MISIDLHISTDAIPIDVEPIFTADIDIVAAAYVGLQDELTLQNWHIKVLLPQDFDLAVQDEINKTETISVDFGSDRVGGTVVGKLLVQDVEHNQYIIIFNPKLWRQSWPFGLERLFQLHAMFHEFGHVLYTDLRHRIPMSDQYQSKSDELSSLLFGIGKQCQEEYMVDRLALELLHRCVTVDVAGDDQTDRILEPLGLIYHHDLIEQLEVMSREWPVIVWNYRLHAIDLNHMVQTIVTRTWEMLTLLSHVQAFRDIYDDSHLFEIDEYAQTRSSRLYFADLWTDFASVLQRFPMSLEPAEFKEADRILYMASSTLLIQLWKRLGLEPRMTEEGCYWTVSEPLS